MLLSSGATISEINCVRRHLSGIKGGRLAAACYPARVLALLISDVPGDNPVDIASGPTVGDPTTCSDALAIVRRYGIDLPDAALEVLRSGRGESVKPGDPRLTRSKLRIIATPQMALEAAAAVARQAGFDAHILSDAIEGEARDVGKVTAAIALQIAERNQPVAAPCVLLSGGETMAAHYPQIDFMRANGFLDHARVGDPQPQVDPGMSTPILADDGGQHVDPRRGTRADQKRPALKPLELSQDLANVSQRREHPFRPLLQEPSGLRQGHPAAEAVEQSHAQLRLQLSNVLGQGRLTRVEGLRGLSVTVREGNREEYLKLPERHAISLDLLI